MSDVILFLTSPSSPDREQLSLANLERLKLLGKDIIVLSTCPNISQRYYDLATLVVFDFYKGNVNKNLYKKANEYSVPYIKPYGSFFYRFTCPTYTIYTDTHFLSVLRNTKNMIQLAYALNYINFLFIEDDHYFSDQGLSKLNEYFLKLNTESLNAIYFTNVWDINTKTNVIHPHFWFGNCEYFLESIVNKLPETRDDLESNFPLSCDYETCIHDIFYQSTYNKQNVYMESIRNRGFESIFGSDTITNQIYSHLNVSDDSRITLLPYNKPNIYKLILNYRLFKAPGIKDEPTDVKVFKNDELISDVKLSLKENINVIDLFLNLDENLSIKIMYDNKVVKEFKNLTKDKVIKNGRWDDI